MHKILFVCHGNICRSPMAEFIMKNIVNKNQKGDQYLIDSAAATNDAVGMTMDQRTKRILKEKGVPFSEHIAKKMTKSDYDKYDYLICMDEENFLDMNQITGGDPQEKEYKLLTFANKFSDIDDPWYTRDFAKAFSDIQLGCEALFNKIEMD